jgi:hypothetical protein
LAEADQRSRETFQSERDLGVGFVTKITGRSRQTNGRAERPEQAYKGSLSYLTQGGT